MHMRRRHGACGWARPSWRSWRTRRSLPNPRIPTLRWYTVSFCLTPLGRELGVPEFATNITTNTKTKKYKATAYIQQQ